MHIGLIGGIGPAATEFYYRGLVRAFAASGQRLELTIAHAHLPDLLANIAADAREQQAAIFREHASSLQAAGAQVVAIASVAGHFCIQEFERVSPLPIVSALTALILELERCGHTRVGLLGTRSAMETRLYGGLKEDTVVLPRGPALQAVHDAYVGMATRGWAEARERDLLFEIGRTMMDRDGARAIVLAGTDLFLAFDGHEPGFPTLDSASVHIEALHRRANRV